MKVSSKEAMAIWHEDNPDFVQEALVYLEEWRWGILYDAIYKQLSTGKFYSATIRVQTGDNYYVDWEDGDVEFIEVDKVPVTVYRYEPVNG